MDYNEYVTGLKNMLDESAHSIKPTTSISDMYSLHRILEAYIQN